MKLATKGAHAVAIVADRIRTIGTGGFAFIPNRFLRDGFFAALSGDELLLYFLFVLVGDRQGISYYAYDSLCALLRWPVERYLIARNNLIDKDLIAYDGTCTQVLSLPELRPAPRPLRTREELEQHDAATVRHLIECSLRGESFGDDDADR